MIHVSRHCSKQTAIRKQHWVQQTSFVLAPFSVEVLAWTILLLDRSYPRTWVGLCQSQLATLPSSGNCSKIFHCFQIIRGLKRCNMERLISVCISFLLSLWQGLAGCYTGVTGKMINLTVKRTLDVFYPLQCLELNYWICDNKLNLFHWWIKMSRFVNFFSILLHRDMAFQPRGNRGYNTHHPTNPCSAGVHHDHAEQPNTLSNFVWCLV